MCDDASNQQKKDLRSQRPAHPDDPWSSHVLNTRRQLPSINDPWNSTSGLQSPNDNHSYVLEWLQQQQRQKQQQKPLQRPLNHPANQMPKSVLVGNHPTNQIPESVLVGNQQQKQNINTYDNVKEQEQVQSTTSNLLPLKPSNEILQIGLNLSKYPPSVYPDLKGSSAAEQKEDSVNRDSWLIKFDREVSTAHAVPAASPKKYERQPSRRVSQNDLSRNEILFLNNASNKSCQVKSKSIGDDVDIEERIPTAQDCRPKIDRLSADDLVGARRCELAHLETLKSKDLSMLFEHCRHPTCINFVSKFTRPYCHEHVGVKENSEGRRVDRENVKVNDSKERHGYGSVNEGNSRSSCDRERAKVNDCSRESKLLVQNNNSEICSMIIDLFCRVTGCANLTAVNVYPFCYEHLDRHQYAKVIVRNTVQGLESDQAQDVAPKHAVHKCAAMNERTNKVNASTMTEDSAFATIHNNSSSLRIQNPAIKQNKVVSLNSCTLVGCCRYTLCATHPVCYEHLAATNYDKQPTQSLESYDDPMNRSLLGREALQEESNDDGPVKHRKTESANNTEYDVRNRYVEAMKEVEERGKRTVARCRSPTCGNFGNTQCAGYCHACFTHVSRNGRNLW